MDYYQVLRVAQNASSKEIEQAYQKLLKESRYDTSINRRQIETAYRTLIDLAAKNRYDSNQTLKSKRNVRVQKIRLKKLESLGQIGVIAWIKKRTLPQLLTTLAIVLTIAIIFYSVRYGYLLREFQAGDILYDTLSKQQFGKILKVEENHNFGSKTVDAYQIEISATLNRINPTRNVIWLPQDTVKQRCYTKK